MVEAKVVEAKEVMAKLHIVEVTSNRLVERADKNRGETDHPHGHLLVTVIGLKSARTLVGPIPDPLTILATRAPPDDPGIGRTKSG